MRSEIGFDISCRIPQWHVMFLQKGVYLEARFILQQPAHLTFR